MAIVVIGGGAIGLLVTGRLVQSNHATALLARAGTAQALAARPLRISEANRTQEMTNVAAYTNPAELPAAFQRPDLAIICVKGYDTPGVLPTLAALQPGQVLSLQNGIGNEEELADFYSSERVIAGVITSSVELEAPDRITVTKSGGIGLASMMSGNAARWAQAFRDAGFRVREYADYRALKWSKALLNMLANATAAILDIPADEVYADRRLVDLERQAFREALAVMERIGARPVNLPRYPAALLAMAMRYLPLTALHPLLKRMIAGGRGGKAPSLQRDLHQGRTRSEGATYYGAIAREAAAVGVAAPTNRALWHILDDIASGAQTWAHYRRQPRRLLEALNAEAVAE